MPTNDLIRVLLELRETTGTGDGIRYSMPPGLYVRDDIFELEIDRIFSREWICIGRSNELPATGDFRTLDLIGEPLILIRDERLRLRVFSNVCRHRLSSLLRGSGRVKRIVCPSIPGTGNSGDSIPIQILMACGRGVWGPVAYPLLVHSGSGLTSLI